MEFARRRFLVLLPCAPGLVLGLRAADGVAFRGKLVEGPALETVDGKRLTLAGDAETLGTLKDPRLAGFDFEVVGVLAGDTVKIAPIHKAALFAHKDGKRLRVTYWCDICAIRTYTPGLCWCCREDTVLDLREPDTVEKK
jgi:hypothetical protein